MTLSITLRTGAGHSELAELIARVRAKVGEEVIVLEAPAGFLSPFPLPALTVEHNAEQVRHFGTDAVEKLREFADKAA